MYYLYAIPYGRLENEISTIRTSIAARDRSDKALHYPVHCTLTRHFEMPELSNADIQRILSTHFRGCPVPKVKTLCHIEEKNLVFLELFSEEYLKRTKMWIKEMGLKESILPRDPYHITICNGSKDSALIYEEALNRLSHIHVGWTIALYKRIVDPSTNSNKWHVVTGA